MMRKPSARYTTPLLVVLLALMLPVRAQTGQALLGNPLLSPAKIKEVKRQIADAAHPQPEQPPMAPPAPAPMQAPPMMQENMQSQRQTAPSSDSARQLLARLQVTAVVGKTAVLATPPPPQNDGQQAQTGQPGQAMQPAPMQMQGFPQGYPQAGALGQQYAQAAPMQSSARRSTATTLRDREPAYIEGWDVIPYINGESVRLVLASAPNTTVFQGVVQPATRTPSFAVAATALEKPNAEYVQGAGPDATSMSQGRAPAIGPNGGQMSNSQLMQQPARPAGY